MGFIIFKGFVLMVLKKKIFSEDGFQDPALLSPSDVTQILKMLLFTKSLNTIEGIRRT